MRLGNLIGRKIICGSKVGSALFEKAEIVSARLCRLVLQRPNYESLRAFRTISEGPPTYGYRGLCMPTTLPLPDSQPA